MVNSTSQSKSYQAIVIEDSLTTSELLCDILSAQWGMETLLFKTGEEAVHYLEGLKKTPEGRFPNVIFLDLGLPGISGLTVLKQLKTDENFKKIPVVVNTGSDRLEDMLEVKKWTEEGVIFIRKGRGHSDIGTTIKKLQAQGYLK